MTWVAPEFIVIQNAGQAIAGTTFWGSDWAEAGYMYLSINAGALRVLVPARREQDIQEMAGASEVIVSRGRWSLGDGRDAIELMWEDGSRSPFCIQVGMESLDRPIPAAEQGKGFVVTVWTETGQQGQWPGRYRVVPEVPWAQPWDEN